MNKIYRIIWNSALNAWVVVSELTRNHTKRASATAAVAVLATLLSATAQASTNASGGGNDPDPSLFDPEHPNFTEDYYAEDENGNSSYKFGLLVVDKDGKLKDTEFATANDDDQGKRTISVEASESSKARPKLSSSYLYLRENGGIGIDQEGRSAKFKVKAGDGLKIDTTTDKLVADTVTLTVNNGKVTAPNNSNGEDKKLVNAGNLATTLNALGWQLKTTNGAAAAGTNATSTVKNGDEVEFKGEDGVTVTSSTTDGKHTVTIRAAQTQGANTGGSWKITAAAEGTGEVDPANNTTESEVNTGEKVTLKAGDNLKIKQNGKDFTYSLKKELKDLTSVEFKDANGRTGSASTKIDKDGLTITPANGAAAGTTTPNANTISVTTSGISAGSKEITNVKSGLKTYKDSQNGVTQPTANSVEEAKKDLVNLTNPATGTGVAGTTTVADSTAATVGDLRGLGWVLSSDKTTDDHTNKQFHAAVKNATEVEFVGKNGATVSAKTGADGKHTVTVDVATVEAGNGLEKDTTTGNTIKLKVKSKAGEENLLTVGNDGVSVTKGEFNTVDTTTPAGQDASANNRGKVTVKASANGTPDDTDNKKVATVGDVAKAINDAATFVKVESTTDDIEDGTANGNTADDQALKAGDTLTFKAGKNLKAKLDKTGKSVTFALAKSIETDSATLSEKLSIGKDPNKVDITSDTNGLKLSKGTNGDTAVHLNGLASTLPDVTTNTGSSTSVTFSPSEIEKTRAATLKDVLNAGWNIKGAKVAGGNTENVDLVAGYDNVEFITGDKNTLDVVLTAKDNGKTTEVKFTPKTSVIKEKDGKLVTGQDGKDNAKPDATNDNDTGTGLVTAKAVIDAVNKSGWRVTGEGATAENGATAVTAGQAQTVTSGTSVNFKNGNATTATVSKDNGNINVKYDVTTGDGLKVDNQKITVNTGDGLKLDNQKIVADTTTLTVTDGKVTAPTADTEKKKLVNAEGLVDALNKLSWKAKAEADTDGEVEPTANQTPQEVKAGETVTFKAGKNLKVKQSGKDFTYSLKDELTGLTSITLGTAGNGANGASTKIDKDGLTITLANGAGATDANKISVTKDGISAGNKAVKNVVSGLKKFGDGHTLANGTIADFEKHNDTAYNGLTNLDEKGADNHPTVADNTAATVGDLRGLGWVISADKTTGDSSKEYHDQVRNANEVKFKSGNGINVSGKTVNGTREITFELAKGEVTNKVSVTKNDNSTVEAVVIDGKYYERDENGKPKLDKEILSTDIKSTDNKGSGYVTGNQVADAIAKSGFELGLADAAEAEKAFAESAKDKQLSKDKAETVNAHDKVRFADGKNTKVSAATVESTDANGEKVTTTFVKTDVELPLTQIYNTDANGKKIVKNADGKWYELKTDGTADTSKEVTLGNVDSDGKKVVKDNDGKWYHAKADGTADKSTQAVDNSKVSTNEKHVVRLDPNNQSNGKGVVIDNVANGDISPTSKQAVNGSQIFALTGNKTPNITSITVDKDGKTVNVGTPGNANDTNKTYHNVVVGEDGKTPLLTTYNVEGRKEVITNSVVEAIYNMNEQGIKFFHSNDGTAKRREERSNDFDSSASGKYATAIGAKADATGNNAIAFGYESKALRDNTVAIGTGNVVNAEKSGAFGDPNYIEDGASGSYAFGNDNRITSKNTFVLGNSVNAKYKADGDVETETVTVKDKDGKNTTVTVPKALGATVENSVYLGNKSTATENPGSNLKSDGTAGNTTTAGATGTVNGFAGATAHGAVSVGASGEERRIQNVAAGEISATSTDAINGSQLYAATKGIADQAVGMVRALKRELEGVAAGANAAAALPQSYLPGKSMISAATGAYGSTGALAVGYSSISDNGKWVVKGQLNVNTRSKAGGGVGVGYIW